MRTRTKGVQLASDGTRSLDKQHRGVRIFERLGKVSQEEAESVLRERQSAIDVQRQNELRTGAEQLFAAAAQKYLMECATRKAKSLETIAYHVRILLPYLGTMPLIEVCNDSLESFVADRIDDDGVKPSTVNRSLEVVRTVLNRAARVWRSGGRPWLAASPLIEMLDERASARPPRPITWEEQRVLFDQMPPHLERMALFTVNTGARDDNVCRLRWDWERPVAELKRSVFVVPAEEFKGARPHILVLNDVAWRIVESCRGQHPEFVFVYRRERVKNLNQEPTMAYHPVGTMNNTAFQSARRRAKLGGVRVHDLRHTYAQRLRDAGVAEEDRALLMGHAIEGMPQHYATATIARLVELANKVSETRDRTTWLKVVNG